jgi:membrane-bound lytic murein transglycosylase D
MRPVNRFLWGVACVVGVGIWNSSLASPTPQTTQTDTLIVATEAPIIIDSITNLPSVSGQLLRERFAGLEKTIPLNYSKLTHGYVDLYVFRKTWYSRLMLERMPVYFPMYEKMLAKYNLPDELKFLSMVESALNPRAISHAGAVGLWQFMPATGRDFRLYQDEYVDDRMDPYKATEAACRYMRDLYNIFGDWELALAAYNSGPGTVRRAMRRSGKTSFYDIIEYLPKETRSYVPLFVAVTYMMHYSNDHGIFAERPEYPTPVDTLHVNSYFSLERFAKYSTVPLAELQKLNPAILSTMLPDYTRGYALRVPSDRFHFIDTNRKRIMDSATYLPPAMANMLLADAESLPQTDLNETADLLDESPLLLLAKATPEIALGAEPVDETVTLKSANALAWRLEAEKAAALKAKATPLAATPKKRARVAEPRYHRVQQGDTLWTICQRYGLLSIDRLKKLNGIKGNELRPGQKLIVG